MYYFYESLLQGWNFDWWCILPDDKIFLSFSFLALLPCICILTVFVGQCQGIVRGSPCFVALWLQGYVKVIKKKKKAMVQIISDTWIWFVKLQTALLPIVLVKISMCIKSMMASSVFFVCVCGWGGIVYNFELIFFETMWCVCVFVHVCVDERKRWACTLWN